MLDGQQPLLQQQLLLLRCCPCRWLLPPLGLRFWTNPKLWVLRSECCVDGDPGIGTGWILEGEMIVSEGINTDSTESTTWAHITNNDPPLSFSSRSLSLSAILYR
jgi:hypothetical protein